MGKRPLFQVGVAALEDMYRTANSQSDVRLARQIQYELGFRKTEKAIALRRKVDRLVAALGQNQGARQVRAAAQHHSSGPFADTPAVAREDDSVQDSTIERSAEGDPMMNQRLRGLLEFVKQTAQLRGAPPRLIEQHRAFRKYEADLLGLPGVSFNAGEGDEDVWLRVDRLHESKPPTPSSPVLAEAIVQSGSPDVEPRLKAMISVETATELGLTGALSRDVVESSTSITLEAIGVADQVKMELDAYIDTAWRPWAAEEKQVRRTIALYSDLFAVNQQLQGNIVETPIELVMGVGVALWKTEDGEIRYPLISKLVEVSIDDRSHAIEVRPRALPAALELAAFTSMDNPGVAALSKAGKEFFEASGGQLSPFEQASFEPLLKTASTLLDSRGVYWPSATTAGDRTLPDPDDQLKVTDTWVIFARPRNSSLFVNDLERFEQLLQEAPGAASTSLATASLVTDPEEEVCEPAVHAYRGVSTIGLRQGGEGEMRDLYFPLPYNDEQVQIIQMLDNNDGVVVQGPPGTGKTHTIANVICHYLASGKRVLVTSMKDPALGVLQKMLPEEVRPLAISLLTSEADGMKQFEHAINRIAAELGRINRSESSRRIKELEGRIHELHGRISATDAEINDWAKRNIEPVHVDGERLMPLEVARQVAANLDMARHIPDKLTISPRHAPQFGADDIRELREARWTLGEDLPRLSDKIPDVASFPDTSRLLLAHQNLARLAELNAEIASNSVPLLVDNEPATIEAAMGVADRIKALIGWRESIDGAAQWLQELEVKLRGEPESDLALMLQELCSELDEVLSARSAFLRKPVSIPDGVENVPDLVAAVRNLSSGARPFGMTGLFGKRSEKLQLNQILVMEAKPASPEDWSHVLAFVEFRKKCASIRVRWNALAGELSLPSLASVDDVIASGPKRVAEIKQVRDLIREEADLSVALAALFPEWKSAAELPYDRGRMLAAQEMLQHNLTRNNLVETWRIREQFVTALDGCKGPVCDRIRGFLDEWLGSPALSDSQIQVEWTSLLDELRRLHALAPVFRKVREITDRIEASGAPLWAGKLRDTPPGSVQDQVLPDQWEQCWKLRRLLTLVEGMGGRGEFERLGALRSEMERDLARLYREVLTTRTWLKLSEKASPAVRTALEAYRVAVSRIGKGTGIRAPRYRKDARAAAERASPAVPCWIMPHYRICESLPVEFGSFDLVIIDEASQSDLSALPAILRGKKVLIVGDDKQVSPDGVGLPEEKIRSLISQYLADQVPLYRSQMSPDRSIYDLFKVVFAKGMVVLREHFRCVAPIIEYSKREFYDNQLRPLRLPKRSERLDPPLIDVHVLDGARGRGKINPGEARFIVEEIRKISTDPEMAGRSLGVVSLLGSEQAKFVYDMVSDELGQEVIERHDIAFGDARTFQGKERDIMFLSMVVSGTPQAASPHQFSQRFNVAASRARDRMYLVRSVALDQLSSADALRRGLIEHFESPFLQTEEEIRDLRSLCESEFEREVFDVLVERGYRVVPQVAVGRYRIDLVVEGENDARLAIECDGDQYHGPDQWDHDIQRQRILERAGWTFWRCFASTFTLHKDEVVEDLVRTLEAHGIGPLGTASEARSIYSRAIEFRAFEEDESAPEPITEDAVTES